jgi:hypothetical protein
MRLPDSEIDRVADYLEAQCGPAKLVRQTYPHGTDSQRKIGVIEAADCPRPGTTTWCTFGLAHQDWREQGFPDRNELVSALRPRKWDFGWVLASAAHMMIDQKFFPGPGTVLRDAVAVCNLPDLSDRMPHLVCMYPYSWGERFVGMELDQTRLWMLQVQPIYENEARFIREKGFETFEEILRAKGVILVDAARKSCIIDF